MVLAAGDPGSSHAVLRSQGEIDALTRDGTPRIIASRVPGARLVLFPNAGHAFLFQERAGFARRVFAFLR